MSWSGTYSHNVLLAIDELGAMLFWNTPDITISSMCGIVMAADQHVEWKENLAALRLYRWQEAILRWLGPRLNEIQANHCYLAIQADQARAQRVMQILTMTARPADPTLR